MPFAVILRRVIPALLFGALMQVPLTAQAQVTKTILVLDASGSMWGQIDGEAKITIAKRVVAELLDTLPADQILGLSAYGHREKGACNDIELLVSPSADSRDAIREAVEGISPRGKTPLSAAVIAAAEQLKYEEDAATVILVSDGRETCDLDPCAVGKQLEETGVSFTAHVIGFDVDDVADKAQLACLAEETGGRFLSASNATELLEALAEVADQTPPPPAITADLLIEATDGIDGPVLTSGLIWTLTPDAEDGTSIDKIDVGNLNLAATPGRYYVKVERPETYANTEAEIIVVLGEPNRFVLPIISALPDASLALPETAVAGSTVLATWTGPDKERDFISVAEADARDGAYINYTYTTEGTPLKLLMPPKPGSFEVRYVLNDEDKVLARQIIEVTPVTAEITAAETAEIGSVITLEWTGPDYPRDYISVANADDRDGSYINYTYTDGSTPLDLQMPAEPGEYEIRYVMNQDSTVIARKAVTVTAVEVTLNAPSSAAVGSEVAVEWVGPDAARDYVSVAEVGARGSAYENYTYTETGSPLTLRMPGKAGEYEIRYILNQDNTILASRMITVEDVAVNLNAPATASLGSEVTITWVGPDEDRDYISVAMIGARGSEYENYTYTSQGSPLTLLMPSKPGDYEIRYVLNQDHTILTSVPITVDDVTATLDAPENARAGAPIVVQWSGPAADRDYISVAEVGSRPSEYLNYTYINEGNPLRLQMPPKPGEYELRYILNQDHTALETRLISITEVSASISAPESATAGASISVQWQGPDYQRDYISIASVGDQDGAYETYSYTNEGSTINIRVPDQPGTYELRYVMNQDNTVLFRKPLTVK